MLKISRVKTVLSKIRSSVKLVSVVGVACLIIVGVVSIMYKPTYSVTLNGKFVGYHTRDQVRIRQNLNYETITLP